MDANGIGVAPLLRVGMPQLHLHACQFQGRAGQALQLQCLLEQWLGSGIQRQAVVGLGHGHEQVGTDLG